MEDTLSSTVAKVSSAISSLYNNFLGQTHSQARLNAIASYDQSNELFKVCAPVFLTTVLARQSNAAGLPQQRDDVFLCSVE